MKIKMVGTGALSVKERSACTLVNDKILVDCGNGIIKTLLEQNVDINKIDSLLITHLHGDHFLDIPFLIMQRKFLHASNELNIYCPRGTEEIISKLVKIAYSDIADWTILRDEVKVKFIEFDSLENQEITKGYFVNSYKVVHGDFTPAYGYVIKNADKSIGFSGDSSYCESIDEIIQASDVSVLDMSFIDSSDKHMGVHDIEMLSKKYDKKIIPTHMSNSSRQYVEKNKIKNVIITKDGQTIELC